MSLPMSSWRMRRKTCDAWFGEEQRGLTVGVPNAHDRGETSRSRADDDDVPQAVRGTEIVEPQRTREVGRGGIAHHALVAQDYDGRLVRADPCLAEQCLGLRVVLEVDPPVRQPVPSRELAESPRVERVARADDPEAGAQTDQHRTAGEKRPKDHVSQRRVLLPAPHVASPAS
jgi:hypothetical protein